MQVTSNGLRGSQHVLICGQVTAARALLGWKQDKLARRSGFRPRTVYLAEAGEPRRLEPVLRVPSALEAAGVTFTGRGVELRGSS